MTINLLNAIFIILILIYCWYRPISGIIWCLLIILSLPPFFYGFGFAFGDGEKYLSNLSILVLAYSIYYFWIADKLGKIEPIDILLIFCIIFVIIISFYASEFKANPGVILKSFVTPILFYYMGKFFILHTNNIENNYLRFRKYLLLLGPYYIVLLVMEYSTEVNFFPDLLKWFGAVVGISQEILVDPTNYYEMVTKAAFHRVIGPILEPTDTALVMMIIFTIYLVWLDANAWRTSRYVILIMLLALIVLSTSRTVIMATLAVVVGKFFLVCRPGKKFVAVGTFLLLTLMGIYSFNLGEVLQEKSYSNPFFARVVEERTVNTRMMAFEEAWSLAKDNLLLGLGTGVEVDILPSLGETSTGLTVHNYYMDNLLFKGLLLSVFLLIIYLILIRRSFVVLENHKNDVIGKIAMTHLLLTLGMFFFYMATHEKLQIAALFWFYSGMIAGVRIRG